MLDKQTLKVLIALQAVLLMSACKKSPVDYYEQFFSAKKLSAKKVIHGEGTTDDAANEEGGEGYRDPITGQRVGGKAAVPTAQQLTEFAPLCSGLVKSMRNEPWFYNFQANIKKAQEKNEHGEFIRSHMAYRRMLSPELTYAPEIFTNCANAVMTIQSFPELRKLRALTADARGEELGNRLTH